MPLLLIMQLNQEPQTIDLQTKLSLLFDSWYMLTFFNLSVVNIKYNSSWLHFLVFLYFLIPNLIHRFMLCLGPHRYLNLEILKLMYMS